MRSAGYGLCLSGLDRYNEADKALLEAHQMLKTRFGAQPERTVKAINALIALYDAWGKPGEAAQWRAKLREVESADEQDE